MFRRQRQRDLTPEEEALLVANLPRARAFLARRGISEGHRNFDTYWSHAMEAVWQAILRFEPERGLKLNTYIGARLHGAFGDAARELDPYTRTGRAEIKAGKRERSVQADLETDLLADGREPPPDHSAEVMDSFGKLAVSLGERDALILYGTIGHGLTCGCIGRHLGLTESRVVQIRQDALLRLTGRRLKAARAR
jgi:RNA polymerase sigma factor (sigma-70 family)